MSDLRLVDRPVLVPGRCMFTGGNGPCVDFLRDFDLDHDGRIYIGVDFAREIGRWSLFRRGWWVLSVVVFRGFGVWRLR